MKTTSRAIHTEDGKGPHTALFHRLRQLHAAGKLIEKILPTRVLREVNERGLLRDEQFVFRPRHSTTLQLARLVERVNRNFDRWLTGAVS
jgi:hypothetical protein